MIVILVWSVTRLSAVVSSRNSSVCLESLGVEVDDLVKESRLGSLIFLRADLARITPPVTTRARMRPITTATVTSFFTFILGTV